MQFTIVELAIVSPPKWKTFSWNVLKLNGKTIGANKFNSKKQKWQDCKSERVWESSFVERACKIKMSFAVGLRISILFYL